MTKKSIDDYSADILQLTVELSLIPPYHPAVEKLTRQLSNRLSSWQALLDITYFIARNEQLPWDLNEYNTKPMPIKSASGYNQVGDYAAYINDYNMFVPLLVERKTMMDAYGTLMSRDSRLRFMNEISRYEKDPRFSQMVIIVECNKDDFLTYIPEVYICSFGQHPITRTKNLKRFFKSYYKMDVEHFNEIYSPSGFIGTGLENNIIIKEISKTEATVYVDKVFRETLTIKDNFGERSLYLNRGASIESRRATVAKLVARGIYVEWAGSREEAQKTYLQLIRQSCIMNYKIILNIEV